MEILRVSPVEVMIDSIIFGGRWFMEFPSQKTDSESHVLKSFQKRVQSLSICMQEFAL